MAWLKLVSSVLTALITIGGLLRERQLISAGEAQHAARSLEEANKLVTAALEARRLAADRIARGGLLDNDGHRRD